MTESDARGRLRAIARRLDEHPVLLAAFRAARKKLPGDDAYGDPLSLSREQAPGVLGQQLAMIAAERPSALKEIGFSALQVWQSLAEAQGRGRGEREVAILFTDLVGFSTWALEAGDDKAVELLRRVARATEPAIAAHGGKVVKRLGDGVMAVFDDAEAAVTAAIEARDAARDVQVDDHSAQLRAGVHVGRPRMLGGDYLGVDVNVAARVGAAAGAGEILVTDSVCAKLPDSVRVKRKWRFSGKGTPAQTKVFAVA